MLRKIVSLTVITSVMFLVAFSMSGCYSKNFIKPTQNLIDEYIKAHPDLPELDKSCLYDGRFEVGMKQETVRFMLEEPKSIEMVRQPWGMQEKWTYKYGNTKIFYMEDQGVVAIEEQ